MVQPNTNFMPEVELTEDFLDVGKRRVPKPTDKPMEDYRAADDSAFHKNESGNGTIAFEKYVQAEGYGFGRGTVGSLVTLLILALFAVVAASSVQSGGVLFTSFRSLPLQFQILGPVIMLACLSYPGYRISKGCEEVHHFSGFSFLVFVHALGAVGAIAILMIPFGLWWA